MLRLLCAKPLQRAAAGVARICRRGEVSEKPVLDLSQFTLLLSSPESQLNSALSLRLGTLEGLLHAPPNAHDERFECATPADRERAL